jgi:YaiO family outer membrane protein
LSADRLLVRAWERLTRAFVMRLVASVLVAAPAVLPAQAPLAGGLPGSWIEANTFAQAVSNRFGDWTGLYVRGVQAAATRTLYGEVLALDAFRDRGLQFGATIRQDWHARAFAVLGANVGDGAPILPKGRVDGVLGLRFGAHRAWQVTAGGSYVKSTTDLYDRAATASLAWYAPKALLLETGVRLNSSNPGDIQSHRVFGVAVLTPSPRRSLSLRAIGGTEGWQIVSAATTLRKFSSEEFSLAWREKLSTHWALSAQGDAYRNPFYTRRGVTLGVARYW